MWSRTGLLLAKRSAAELWLVRLGCSFPQVPYGFFSDVNGVA